MQESIPAAYCNIENWQVLVCMAKVKDCNTVICLRKVTSPHMTHLCPPDTPSLQNIQNLHSFRRHRVEGNLSPNTSSLQIACGT
jgi:hypothetical protein